MAPCVTTSSPWSVETFESRIASEALEERQVKSSNRGQQQKQKEKRKNNRRSAGPAAVPPEAARLDWRLQRKRRSHDEKLQATKHLFYEFSMMRDVLHVFTDSYVGDPMNPTEAVIKNALIESFLNHARVLSHVVGWHGRHRKGPHPDDVVAEDFDKNWKPSKRPPGLDSFAGRASEQLVHLSYNRQGANKTWNMGEIARSLMSEVVRFVRRVRGLAPEAVSGEWDPYIADAIASE